MPASIMSSFMRLQVLEDGLGARELYSIKSAHIQDSSNNGAEGKLLTSRWFLAGSRAA